MDEAIAIHGHETYYLRREDVNVDQLFGEDALQRFSDAREIEMYIKTSQSFQGMSETMSKFGLQIEDQCTFSVSQRRFSSIYGDILDRPREGDIIWLQMTPDNRYLFEIRFVENKEQLFQLGKLYTYEIRCELMNYSHERVETSVPEINEVAQRESYTLQLSMGTGVDSYVLGETVYQGASFLEAVATGTVVGFDATTNILLLQDITGTFISQQFIIGITSGASRIIVTNVDTMPSVADPISDNALAQDSAASIIIIRGSNPRHASSPEITSPVVITDTSDWIDGGWV
jgi:hypothetical protein